VSLFGSSRREGMVAVLVLLLLCVLMHAPGLFLGQPRLLTNKQARDLHRREASTNQNVLMPALQAAGRVVSEGEVPLWNPYARLGESFLGSGAPLLYPPFWPLMAEGSWRLLDLILCLHSFIACACMYRFLRNLPLSRFVSFVGGAMYGLGWCMTVQLDRLPHAAAAAWLPLAMAMTWRVLVSKNRELHAMLLALTVVLMFATGGTGTALLGVFLCVVVYGFGFLALDSQDKSLALRAVVGAVAMTVLLTSPLWLYWTDDATAHAPPDQGSNRHLQASGVLLGMVSPTAFGGITGSAPGALRDLNPDADPVELALYPGAAVLFLVLLGLLRPKRTAHGLVWILVGGLGLFMTLDSPIAELAGRLWPCPPLSPGLGLVLLNIAMVSMAAVSLENFFEAPVSRRFAVPATAATFLAGAALAALAGHLYPDVGSAMVSLLSDNDIAAEVQPAAAHLFDALVQPMISGCLIAIAFLCWRRIGILRFKVLFATLAIADVMLVGLSHTPRSAFPDDSALLGAHVPADAGRIVAAGRSPTLPTGRLVAAGLPTLNTTSSGLLDRTRRFLKEVDASMVHVGSRAMVVPLLGSPLLQDPLLELAGVGIGICTTPVDVSGFVPAGRAGSVHVYRRRTPPPRVRVLFQAVLARDMEEAARLLNTHANHLGETVVIEEGDPGFVCKRPGALPRPEILDRRSNEVRIRLDMGQGRGYLLLADAHAPGWQALLDGVEIPIRPADVAMRAVAVPEGIHEVVFRYSPLWWWLGLPLAGLGVLMGMAWTFLRLPQGRSMGTTATRRPPRPRPAHPPPLRTPVLSGAPDS